MRGEIVRPKISLHFHDSPDALHPARVMNEQFPKQIPGDLNRGPIVE